MEGLSSASAASADEAQQERPDEGPVHATSRSINGPNEGVVHHEEDEKVIRLGDEGLSLDARGPKKSTMHADIETTGEDEEESTSVLTKSAVRGFSGVKQLALIAAIGVMLAVFGRRLMRPISAPVKPPSSDLQPPSDLQQPESPQEKVLLPPVEKDIDQPTPPVSITPEEPPLLVLQPPSDLQQPESPQEKVLLPPVEKDIQQPPPPVSITPEEPPSSDLQPPSDLQQPESPQEKVLLPPVEKDIDQPTPPVSITPEEPPLLLLQPPSDLQQPESPQEKVLLPPVEKDIQQPPPPVSITPEEPPSSDLQPPSDLQQPESPQEKVLLPPVEKDIQQPPPPVSITPEEPPSSDLQPPSDLQQPESPQEDVAEQPSAASSSLEEPRSKDIEELESQQSELRDKVELLRRAWEHAGKEVKMIFVSKLASFKQLLPGDSRSNAVAIDEQILKDILIPAAKVQQAPFPPTPEDRVTLRRQLVLMSACVSAAYMQLTSWQDFFKARREQGEQLAKTSSVSAFTFMRLIEDEAGIERPEVQDQSSPRIDWYLAWNIAMSVAEIRMQAIAAAKSYEAFAPFLEELEEAEHSANGLQVPEGGVFPAKSFINFMEGTRSIKKKLSDLALEAAKKLADNFTEEGAHACFSEIGSSAAAQVQTLENLKEKATKGIPGQDRRLYLTMLGLLCDA